MKGKRHESRIDHTDREPERKIKERRILFPAVPGAADRTEMSERMERYPGTEGGKKTFNAYLWKVCGQEYDAQHPRS